MLASHTFILARATCKPLEVGSSPAGTLTACGDELQVDVEVARKILNYVLDDIATHRGDDDEGEGGRDPDEASDEDGGSPRAPL